MRASGTFIAVAVFGIGLTGWILIEAHGRGPARAADREPLLDTAGDGLRPSGWLEASPEFLERGRTIYGGQCAPCHGSAGAGDGPAAYLLYPKPRDFIQASYRFVSTWERVPTDEDLFRTVSRGIPGSAMPSWSHLREGDRWALVHYIKSLAAEPWTIAAPTDPAEEGSEGTGVIRVPPEPPDDEPSRQRGRDLFIRGCAPCHGLEAKGDGPQDQRDERGYPIRPRDLNTGVYKGSPEPEDLYRRIVAGLPGTPMPGYAVFHGVPVWDLVHYARSLSSDDMRIRAEMTKLRIEVGRVDRVPDHPDDGAWRDAPPVNLHLMPLWWRYERPEYLTVQALHDGEEIAVLLIWADDTNDEIVLRPQDFRDAAAVQLSPVPDPPFFAMGSEGTAVNIWMWKADRQRDLLAFTDLESQYPNIGIDSYPNLEASPLEQPMRHALTLDSDPAFVTGWGAGNIVSDPTRKNAAEELTARGFGTLRARPFPDQTVTAKGGYSTGSYRVVFRRPLESRGKGGVSLRPGETVPAAFAVWDGSAGDRDGKKSVSIWQELVLEP